MPNGLEKTADIRTGFFFSLVFLIHRDIRLQLSGRVCYKTIWTIKETNYRHCVLSRSETKYRNTILINCRAYMYNKRNAFFKCIHNWLLQVGTYTIHNVIIIDFVQNTTQYLIYFAVIIIIPAVIVCIIARRRRAMQTRIETYTESELLMTRPTLYTPHRRVILWCCYTRVQSNRTVRTLNSRLEKISIFELLPRVRNNISSSTIYSQLCICTRTFSFVYNSRRWYIITVAIIVESTRSPARKTNNILW